MQHTVYYSFYSSSYQCDKSSSKVCRNKIRLKTSPGVLQGHIVGRTIETWLTARTKMRIGMIEKLRPTETLHWNLPMFFPFGSYLKWWSSVQEFKYISGKDIVNRTNPLDNSCHQCKHTGTLCHQWKNFFAHAAGSWESWGWSGEIWHWIYWWNSFLSFSFIFIRYELWLKR